MMLSKLICYIVFVNFPFYLAEYVNIAVGKYAQQSSTLNFNSADWTAYKALDQQMHFTESCHCCSLTQSTPMPQWWELDLGQMFDVSKIDLYGRDSLPHTQSQTLMLYISNTTRFKQTKIFNNTQNYGNGHYEIDVHQQRFQFIYIEKNNTDVLALCEVKVWIDCHCSGGPCDSMTGVCAHGCQPGYTGTSCALTCTAGTYGQNCLNNCHCQNFATCNHITGRCPSNQCASGWFGTSCDQNCHCFGGPCDSTGLCSQGCLPGYMGASCTRTCTSGSYGQDCQNNCHCRNSAPCDHITGHCSSNQCVSGWIGTSCDQNCHCSGEQCDSMTGLCAQGCQPGYNGTSCTQTCTTGTYGLDCQHYCHCQHSAPCDHITGRCSGNQCASGWFGMACDQTNSLALNKAVDMPPHYSTWVKEFATDSNIRTDPNTCWCCAATGDHMTDPWLQVDLGALYRISTITIYGRTDYYGLDQSFTQTEVYVKRLSNETGTLVNQFTGPRTAVNVVNVTLSSFTTARFVQFILKGQKKLLVVCDLQVFPKVCPLYRYGDNCEIHCHCKGETCNDTSGICPSGKCEHGYQLQTCSIRCNDEYYGDCTQPCGECLTTPVCNKTTGYCDDCKAGHQLTPLCKTECTDGTYGYHCGKNCSNCSDMTECNKVNGTCPDCQPGYQGPKCDTPCDAGTYGNCSEQCGSCKTSCDTSNGHCDDCNDGYMYPLCQIECSDGTYGHRCLQQCGHCSDMSECNNADGTCLVCLPGYQGSKCDTPCKDGYYGDCTQQCGECRTTSCNKTTGYCDDCNDGYIFPFCKTECETGTYGHLCNETCGNCLNINECNTEDGTCPVCQDGYQGSNCDTQCTDGHFGFNCSNNCTNCNATQCNFITGICFFGCSKGFSGSVCEPILYHQVQDDTDGSTPAVIAAVISVGLLVVIIVVAGLIFAKRKGFIGKPNEANRPTEQFDSLRNPELSLPVVQAKKHTIAVKPKTKATVKEQHEIPTVANDYYSFTPRKDDIKLNQLWDYIKTKMADEKKLLYEEFAQLDTGLVMEHKIAMLPANRVKNRYREMYAYDHSRVPLIANMEGESEYINACFIDGLEKPAKFIASQGATKFMIDDFWRMVWQQKSNTIVMLTNLIEMGTEKCMQYWPTEGSRKFENITVKLIKEETCIDYVVRHLQVKENENEYRTVTQYHFKSWPDKDVPDSAWCLVNFWRTVCADKKVKGPIVVHCSAGVGRTGTFIAIDNIYNQAMAEGNVRPLQIVEALRRQRVNMVQTKEQYVYLHEAVADALYFGTHFIWTKQFEDVFRFMKQTDLTSSISRLETQYNLICESIEKREVQEENEYSNVDTISTEMDAYRPKSMNCNKGIGGAIEAVCLPNITGLDAFVVTDTPVDNSCADFWRLIEDQNIKTIITITSDTTAENNVMRYIGSKGSPTVGKFDVNALDEKKRSSFIDRNFTFKESNKDIDELTTVKMFEFSAWRDNEETPGDKQSVLDLLDAVYRWQPQSTDKQPILVYSGEGINKSGVVCALMNELHRMRQNGGQINIVETVKTMKQRDRDIIANFDQYRYCHDVILHHINQTEVYQNI